MGNFDFILYAIAPPIHPAHAYCIALMLITTVVIFNVLNSILLRQQVFKINQRLTKEVENLKCRLKHYEADCDE